MGAWKKATLLAGLMMISGLAGCFGNDDDESKGEMVAVFTYSPASNIRAEKKFLTIKWMELLQRL